MADLVFCGERHGLTIIGKVRSYQLNQRTSEFLIHLSPSFRGLILFHGKNSDCHLLPILGRVNTNHHIHLIARVDHYALAKRRRNALERELWRMMDDPREDDPEFCLRWLRVGLGYFHQVANHTHITLNEGDITTNVEGHFVVRWMEKYFLVPHWAKLPIS